MHLTGDQIKVRRKELNLSQKQLADLAGVSRSYIAQIEAGTATNVSDEHVRSIAAALMLPTTEQTGDDNIPLTVRIAQLQVDFESNEHDLALMISRAAEIERCLATDRRSVHAGDLFTLSARMLRKKGDYSSAYRHAYDAQSAYSLCSEVYRWCKATYEIASIDFYKSEYGHAIELFRQIDTRLRETGFPDDTFKTQLYVSLATALSAIGEVDEAISFAMRVEGNIEFIEETQRDRVRANNNYLRGIASASTGSFEDALRFLNIALAQFEDISDGRNVLRMKNNIARLYFKKGDIQYATELVENIRNLDNFSSLPWDDTSETILLLAQIAEARSHFPVAVENCEYLIKKGADPATMARAHRVLAWCSYKEGNLSGFNKSITDALTALDNAPFQKVLGFELMREYMIVNHRPDSLVLKL
jgi:transcriptional regulator with XRE-family HTH domain